MPGPQHARMSRPEVDRLIVAYASATYPFDVREYAVRAAHSYNELLASPLDEQGFESAVSTLNDKLAVAMPAVPADLSALTDAQAVALADALELAQWDFHRRCNAMGYTHQFWVRRGGVPTSAQYLAMFYRIANFSRTMRGLPNIS